jgi:hypothetical protein
MCVLESRTFLERADFQHFGFAAPTFVLAFSGLFVVMVGSPAALMLRKWHARTRIYASAALFILLAIAEYPNLRLNSVTRKWREIESSRQLPDAQILRADYAAAVEEMQAKISQQSCFYTLTSEGTWYYLFDRPSCSTFAQLNYARTTQGQQQVIADLRRFRPRIILLNGDLRDGSYDYIPLQEHSANVWNYVLATYQPLRTIGGFHFYELRE